MISHIFHTCCIIAASLSHKMKLKCCGSLGIIRFYGTELNRADQRSDESSKMKRKMKLLHSYSYFRKL